MYDQDDETVNYIMGNPERQKPRSEHKWEDRHELDLLEMIEQDDFYGMEDDDE